MGGIKFFEEFADKINFKFSSKSKYIIFNHFCHGYIRFLNYVYEKVPMYLLDETIRKEIDSLGNISSMTTFLFSKLCLTNCGLNHMRLNNFKLNEFIQKQNKVIWSQQVKIFELQRQLENKK